MWFIFAYLAHKHKLSLSGTMNCIYAFLLMTTVTFLLSFGLNAILYNARNGILKCVFFFFSLHLSILCYIYSSNEPKKSIQLKLKYYNHVIPKWKLKYTKYKNHRLHKN